MHRVLISVFVILLSACSKTQEPQRRAVISSPPKPAIDTEREKARQKAEDELTGRVYESRDGAAEAKADIAAGAPKLKVVGLTRKDQHIHEQLFLERFGVKMEVVAGCAVSSYLSKYVKSYNQVVYDYIAARYGKDAVASAEKDAWEMFKANENGG